MSSAAASSPMLSTRLKAGWGVGSVGTQIVLFSQSLLLLYFFTRILGLEPALAGTLLFAAKIYDAAIAPVVGRLSDGLRSPLGRRRPFLLAGALLCAAGLLFVFNPPSASPVVLFIGLLLISTGYSLFNIPYLAMAAEMTDSPLERTGLMAWRVAFVGVGTIVATAVLPLVARAWGGDREAYGLTGVVAAALAGATLALSFVFTRGARATQSAGETFSLREMAAAVVANRPFGYLLIAKTLQLVGLASASASMLFFFKDVLGTDESALAWWGLAANGTSIVAMLFWPALGKRWGKVPIYCLCLVGFAAFGFSWLLADETTTLAGVLVRGIGAGVFIGGLLLMGQSLLPDTIAEDHRLTRLRREGVFSGAYSFVEKASSALGPMIVGLVFQLMGFATGGGVKGGNPQAAYIAVAVIPSLAYLLSAWPVLRIRLGVATAADLPPGSAAPAARSTGHG